MNLQLRSPHPNLQLNQRLNLNLQWIPNPSLHLRLHPSHLLSPNLKVTPIMFIISYICMLSVTLKQNQKLSQRSNRNWCNDQPSPIQNLNPNTNPNLKQNLNNPLSQPSQSLRLSLKLNQRSLQLRQNRLRPNLKLSLKQPLSRRRKLREYSTSDSPRRC